MNNRIIIIILINSGFVAFCQADFSTYIYDKFFESELQCLLQTGKCSGLGQQIKLMLPVILKDDCAQCNMQQKRNFQRMIQFMQSRYPSAWRKIQAIYTSPTYVNNNK